MCGKRRVISLKKIIALILALVFSMSLFMFSCNDPVDSDSDTDTGVDSDTGTDSNNKKDTDTDKNNNKDEDDGPSFDTVIEHKLTIDDIINLDVFDSEVDAGDSGVLDYTTQKTLDVSEEAAGMQLDILEGGVYKITGTTEEGNILINLKSAISKKIVLVLDNVHITSKGQKAPIYASNCESITIVIPSGTDNVLIHEAEALSTDKGAIHVKSSNLTINGKGKLTLKTDAEKGRGIYCSKELTINGGVYDITSEKSHGIQGQDGLIIKAGSFNIVSAKGGLKSGDYDEKPNEKDAANPTIESNEGNLTIEGGSFNIKSGTNGISAYGAINIKGGKIVIDAASSGIDCSRELAAAKADTGKVVISGGILVIKSADDGIKANVSLAISGSSNVKINSGNDGIDIGWKHSGTPVDDLLVIETTGIVYIKTEEAFVEKTEEDFIKDPEGKTYIWKNNRYQLITDPSKYPKDTLYKLESCKGIKVDGGISILKGTVCVDSFEDAFDGTDIVISGGRIIAESNDDGFDIDGTITISSGSVEILNSNKGIKSAEEVEIMGDATITVLSSSDAIESLIVSVKGGFVVLLEKLEILEGGSFEHTGGTMIVAASTKKPVDGADVGISLKDTSKCVYGKWMRISKGDNNVVLMLPKSYADKMSVSVISSDVTSGEYKIEVGTFKIGGDRYNSFVYANGNSFTTEYSTSVTVE